MTQGAGEQDGTAGVPGEFDEGGQAGREAGGGGSWIDDEETDIQLGEGSREVVEVTRKFEGAIADGGLWRFLGEGTVEGETGGIASGSEKAGEDGVLGSFVGGDEQNVGLLSRRTIGQRCATRDAGGQGEGEQREAGVWGSIEEREVAEGDAIGPQPGEGLAGDVGEASGGGGRWGHR